LNTPIDRWAGILDSNENRSDLEIRVDRSDLLAFFACSDRICLETLNEMDSGMIERYDLQAILKQKPI
jgi:hypothetical protein